MQIISVFSIVCTGLMLIVVLALYAADAVKWIVGRVESWTNEKERQKANERTEKIVRELPD